MAFFAGAQRREKPARKHLHRYYENHRTGVWTQISMSLPHPLS